MIDLLGVTPNRIGFLFQNQVLYDEIRPARELPLNNKHIKENTFGHINKNGRGKQIKIVFRARENDLY